MTRFTSWLLVLALFGGLSAVAGYLLRARAAAGREMPPFSVYSEEGDGLAEAARVLRKLGWEPVALTRPIQQLKVTTSGPRLLWMVEPESNAAELGGDFTQGELRNLLRWVADGNTLVLCSRQASAFHQELGLAVLGDRGDRLPVEVVLGEGGPYTDGIDHLITRGRMRLEAGKGLPLWWLDGKPGAVLLRQGRGRVLVVADPSLLTRRGLGDADNVLFLYNVVRLHARDGRVYFDEYHHGLHSGGGFWGYLGYHGLHWLLMPVLLALGMACWSSGVRLGRAVVPPTERQADAVDFASGLGRIYRRAGVRHLLARVLARDFLEALTLELRLRRQVLPAELLAAWKRQRPDERSAQQLQALLHGVAELRDGNVSERRLLNWTREFDRFLKPPSIPPLPRGG